jgi:hypothetical protein
MTAGGPETDLSGKRCLAVLGLAYLAGAALSFSLPEKIRCAEII